MDDRFRLHSAANERIYRSSIEPGYFGSTTSVSNPTIIIVAGQTGAGKSNLVQAAQRELQYNAVFINTDELRPFHPAIDEINSLGDERSAERTHHDASLWRDKLLQRSADTHRNIIWEGVFKDAESLVATIGMLKENGYSVIVRFVAAHERFSILGIHSRYELAKAKSGCGRFAPLDYHNECYRRLLETADKVEGQQQADVVEVYNRHGELLLCNEANVRTDKSARLAIETERARKLNAEERTHYIESWNEVLRLMNQRGASSEEIAQVREQANKLINETTKS